MKKSFKIKGPLMAVRVIAATLLSTLTAHGATLKSDVSVYSDYVTVQDLFEGAETLHDEPLFLAPDLGKSGTISASRVAQEAYDIGLFQIDLNGIKSVTVRRPSQKVTREDILVELKQTIEHALPAAIDFEINTTSIPDLTHADPKASDALAISNMQLQPDNQRFQAVVTVNTQKSERSFPVRGVIVEMMEVATITRDLKREEIVSAGDVQLTRIPKSRVRPGSIDTLKGVIGKSVTRNLRADSALREQDVIEPLIVRKNTLVTISYTIPGLILTAQGRALDSGAKNAIISVRNLKSQRIIRGRVTETGDVIVEVRDPRLVTNLEPTKQKVQ